MFKNVMIVIVGYVLLIWGGRAFVGGICRRLRPPEREGGEGDEMGEDRADHGLVGAGKYMGYFERLIVASAAFLGRPEWSVINITVLFLLSGKLLLMHLLAGGARDRRFLERHFAGTLASLFVALVIGYVLKILLPDFVQLHSHSGLM